MMRENVIADEVLYSYYIRYTKLNELLNGINIDGDRVYVYIDVFNMLKPLRNANNLLSNNRLYIVSGVINLAAHIRSYFKYNNIKTTIYLIYGRDTSTNHIKFYPGFRDTIYNNTNNVVLEEQIELQLKMIKIICNNISNVYCIDSMSDFSMFTYSDIVINGNKPSIIITKNKYAEQIPAFANNSIILYPKKYLGDDVSLLINNNNLLHHMFDTKSDRISEQLSKINPKLCSAMLSITGLKSKGMNRIANITTASSRIYRAIEDNRIINDYNSDIGYLYKNLYIEDKIDICGFTNRFNAIDLLKQSTIYVNSPESKDLSWCIDINNLGKAAELNNTYFSTSPLNVLGLVE